MKPIDGFTGLVAALLIAGSAAIAITLVAAQAPFADSRFEFQQFRDYSGTLAMNPYPSLLVSGERLLLVNPGKHGASIAARDGSAISLRGALIARGLSRMLEVEPDSVRPGGVRAVAAGFIDLGEVTVTGEIADSKCYYGVMNPGSGKVHKDCAIRCLRGGIPPVLIARDAEGRTRTLILAGPGNMAIGKEALTRVGEPVEIRGRLRRLDNLLILESEILTSR